MFIPRYWSEASHLERFPARRQVTVRRFGWSSTSQADADVQARRRVEEAVAVLREGGAEALRSFTRRERVVAYSGSDGLPIREEIVQEWPSLDVVVTRNGYGVLCLNTTRAMFVDVDRPVSRILGVGCGGALAGATAGGLVGTLLLHWNVVASVLGGAFVVWGLTHGLARALERHDPRMRNPVAWAIGRARAWCESRPAWRIAAYETPAGARLLPLHAPFDAAEESTFEFMHFVRADPLYERMCRLQRCFRARVSPKPWRAGVQEHFRAGGTWPVRDTQKLARRARWLEGYERASRGYASCRFVEDVGSGKPDPDIEGIRSLHDEMSRARSDSDLA